LLKVLNLIVPFLFNSLENDCGKLATWFKVKELDIPPRKFQRAFGINSEIISEDK
jgi:hypothetical protein